jgi:hypothetical protein
MKREITEHVVICDSCQRIKAVYQKPARLLQPLQIPQWKWDEIGMDFIIGLPRTGASYDSIWVVVDRLTKSAHFIPVKTSYSSAVLVELYMSRIVCLHGVPKKIVSDRGTQFTSHFWQQLHEALGTHLNFSSAYHPQTDGQTKRTNQVLEDMLRACAFQQVFGPDILLEAKENIKMVLENLRIAQSRQRSCVDTRRRELNFEVRDFVYLNVSPIRWVRRFGVKSKLAARYVGLYLILVKCGEVAYQLSLPEDLSALHDVFHVSYLKKCLHVLEEQLPVQGLEVQEDLTYIEKPTQILETADRVTRRNTIRMCNVRWGHQVEEEATWEREDDLMAKYPELFAGQPWISRERFF